MALQVPSIAACNILELLHGFYKTEIIQQAIKFGIFDKLDVTGEPLSIQVLAKDLDLPDHALERFLNACTGMGLLHRIVKEKEVFFSNSEASRIYLTSRSPFNVLDLAKCLSDIVMPTFKLEESIRSGDASLGEEKMQQTIESPQTATQDDFFKLHCTAESKSLHVFANAMDSITKTCLPLITRLKLDKFTEAVDLGGGFGTIAGFLKKMYPKMTVILADLPQVIEAAKKQDREPGIEYIKCDFFDVASLPKADLFLLGHIIHDWSESECDKIIKNVFDSLIEGGAILLFEKVLQPNKDGPQHLLMMDLGMLAHTSGKERTENEYEVLLLKHGFKRFTCIKDERSPYYDAIMAYKME